MLVAVWLLLGAMITGSWARATTSEILIRLRDGTSVSTSGCAIQTLSLSVPQNVARGEIDCRPPDPIFKDGFEP